MSSILVNAAVDDLEALARALRATDAELLPTLRTLEAAIEAAWSTNGTLLGPRPTLDAELAAQRQRIGGLADGCDAAALRFRVAGSTTDLRAALPGLAGGPAARLAARRLAMSVLDAAGAVRAAAVAAFATDAGPPPFVVRSQTEEVRVAVVGDVGVRLVREVRSDGSVRVTKVGDVSAAVGPGAGLACRVKADGVVLVDGSLGAAASTRFGAGTTESWLFPDEEAADAWLEVNRYTVLVNPGGLGHFGLGAPTPDERTEQLALGEVLEAGASLGLAELTALAGGSSTTEAAVRRNDDGTVTIIQTSAVEVSAEGQVVLAGSVQAGLHTTVELTVDLVEGRLVSCTQTITDVDRAGLELTLPDALRAGAMSATATTLPGLHRYETEIVLDLTDARTVDALERELGIDAGDRTGQLEAVRAALELDPAAINAAAVLVTERTTPTDQQWAFGCDIEAIVGTVPIAVSQGLSSQRTVAAAYKAPGQEALTDVAVPPAPALASRTS
ncbi:MAG: hypothetical protein AB7O92_03445 [Acidimicrobiia bacterium]